MAASRVVRSTGNTIRNALIAKDAAKAGMEAVAGEKALSPKMRQSVVHFTI